MNPEYEVKILDQKAADELLANTGISRENMPAQALSDVIRAKLLLDNGGIWVDATLLPMLCLDDWLPALIEDTGFFAFNWFVAEEDLKPDWKRISSWFIAAEKGNILIQKLWKEIERFWSTPRTLGTYGGLTLPKYPVACVAPGSELSRRYPYFWFHYLFQYMTESDSEAEAAWAKCHKLSAVSAHAIQEIVYTNRPVTAKELIEAAHTAPVQKLTWRKDFPGDQIAEILK